jgi:hypothetical protein
MRTRAGGGEGWTTSPELELADPEVMALELVLVLALALVLVLLLNRSTGEASCFSDEMDGIDKVGLTAAAAGRGTEAGATATAGTGGSSSERAGRAGRAMLGAFPIIPQPFSLSSELRASGLSPEADLVG